MTTPSSPERPISVLRMSAPLVVSFWMRAAVTFVDTIYAATLGDAAVAAVGLTVPFEFLMIAVWVGLSTGLTAQLSHAMGAQAHARITQYLRVGWRLVWIVSPLFTLLGLATWVWAPHAGLAPDVADAFRTYSAVLLAGSAFTTFWSIIPDSLVKAHHDTRSTMWAGICTNLINVVLNTLFVFGFGWGVFGIALSTVLGRLGGLVYALRRAEAHETRRRASVGLEARRDETDPCPQRAILRLAVPSSLTFGLMATESALINLLLARLEHATEAIAAYAIYFRLVLFALQPVIASSVAMLPYAARRLGAQDPVAVLRGLHQAFAATAAYAVLIVGPLVVLGAPALGRALSESPITAAFTTSILYAIPLACLVSPLFLLCRPAFEAMGRGAPGLAMATLRYVVLTGPLCWLGIRIAERGGWPGLHGAVGGTLLAAALPSCVFYLWLRAAIAAEAAKAIVGPASGTTAGRLISGPGGAGSRQ